MVGKRTLLLVLALLAASGARPATAQTIYPLTRAEILAGAMRLVGPLFIPAYERGWAKGMLRLKAMMESGELRSEATAGNDPAANPDAH